ncbi:MAG: alpha/beta fold hydrolase [Nocardiaceae bacterium]|nr:alpha/beta fold hydrolase [Nocardiaceae bacterium]
MLLHGSGPGASAGVNWYRNIEALSQRFRVIAPDLIGFGKTGAPSTGEYGIDGWIAQVLDILDALELPTASLVGNSLGARIALNVAAKAPERVDSLVLMGGVSPSSDRTAETRTVHSYEPDREQMRMILRDLFAYDPEIVDEAMIDLRYEDTIRPGVADEYVKVTTAISRDRAPGVFTPELVRSVSAPTLVVHGMNDRVVPVTCAYELLDLIDGAEGHLFTRCGHWAQIEHAPRFNTLVTDFLRAADE